MEHHGLYIIMAIIFAETGLFIGFLLPGDHLLFVTGLLLKGYPEPYESDFANWFYWSTLITICAVLGNYVGYIFGHRSGQWLFNRKDTWYLKKRHLEQAQKFYEKKGGIAIIIARFVPVVRTFAPIVAGVVKMDFKKFTLYNIIGAAIWVYGLTIVGFILGTNQWVHDHLEYIIIGLILVTTGPVLYKMIFGKSVNEATHIAPDEKKLDSLDEDKI
ncbi:MAG: VTT domain-containing protein [Taibaiella sp.]|nr:VTT domain-containing protein [Taibaiella sp.]